MPDLIVAGLVIPLEALGEHSQSYQVVGGRARLRMADGSQVAQQRWAKLSTVLRASGWAPAALDGLDWGAPVEILCVAPRALSAVGNVIALPATRRLDVAPVGQAVVGGRVVATAVELVGDVATCAAVAGASAYRVLYWPRFTAWLDLEQDLDVNQAAFGWVLTAEEA